MQNIRKNQQRSLLKFFSSSTFLPLLGVILLGAAIIFWRVQEARNLKHLTEETAIVTRSYARESEFRFNSINAALHLLIDQGNQLEGTDLQHWLDDADFYVHAFTGLRFIALIDKDYQIGEIVPSEYETELKEKHATEIAANPGEIHIWLPFFEDNQFKGFLLAILDIDEFMRPVMEETQGLYEFQVTEENEIAFETSTPFDPIERFTASQPMAFQDQTILTLTLSPTRTMVNAAVSAARNTFIFTLLAVGLTVAAVYIAQNFNRLARQNEQRYRNLFNASRDAIFINNIAGEYTHANPAAFNLVGYSLAEIRKMTVDQLLHEQNLPPAYDRAALWQEGGQIEALLRHKDGHPIPVEMTISPLRITNGHAQYVIGIARDVSDRKELEKIRLRQQEQLEALVATRTAELNLRVEEVENLNKAMNEMLIELQTTNQNLALAQKRLQASNDELESFSYSVSHDLRAPLRHIDGFLHLLAEHEKDKMDDTSRHYLQNISESTRRMSNLINHLLQLSRTTRTEIKFDAVNTQELLQAVLEELLSPLDECQIDFQVEPLPPVIGDLGLLHIVLMNLLNNAVKFTANTPHPQIQIGWQAADNNRITIYIRDNGAGFNPEYANKLFTVFQRLHNETEFKGSGIGLATVKRIINRHGGEVWADGKEGEGATFYFTLNQAQSTGG